MRSPAMQTWPWHAHERMDLAAELGGYHLMPRLACVAASGCCAGATVGGPAGSVRGGLTTEGAWLVVGAGVWATPALRLVSFLLVTDRGTTAGGSVTCGGGGGSPSFRVGAGGSAGSSARSF